MNDATPTDPRHSVRLESVIAACLRAAQLGIPVDRAESLARHPDLAEHLRAFFAAQDQQRGAETPIAGGEAPTLPPAAPGEIATQAETLPPRKEAETLPPGDHP